MKALEPQDRHAKTRSLCRTDLYFLLVYICGRLDMQHPWLFARCREVDADPDGRLDLWAREHYKAVDVDEPVPTPSGWTTHGALSAGDWVYGSDGSQTRVVDKTEVFTEADCYRVSFDDGYNAVVSGDHLWEVQKRTRKRQNRRAGQDREAVVMKTKDMADHTHAADNRLAVAISPSIDMPDVILPVMPYTLGLWLGDGDSATGRITCGDQECFERVRQDGYEIGEPPPSCTIVRTIYGLSPILRGLGLLKNKHIPILFKRSSTAQRLELLRGLMDSDGHCNTRGTATFVNKSEILSRDFFDLCASLGMKPRWRAHKHGVYHVSFQAYEGQCPFFLPRKAARCRKGDREARRFVLSVEPVESRPVSCIQVAAEDGLYMIGRHYCLTHNSTIITFGKTIQRILSSHGEDAPDPRECTIGIFSHSRPIAKGFLLQIKREFEANKVLLELFPDILFDNPERDAPKWSEDGGLVVRRRTNPKESTVEAWGLVDAMPTSKHFTDLVYDDVVVPGSVTTPEMIQKTSDALSLSYSLGAEGGCKRFIGTRYHFADAYKTVMDRGTAVPRIHAATHDGTPEGFPVLLTRASLADKRRNAGPYIFSSQYLLNPKADETQGFQRSWVEDRHNGTSWSAMNTYLLFDPASAKKKTSDYTSAWAVGLSSDQRVYVLDIVRDRLNLSQRTKLVFDWHRKYQPMQTRYEKYGKDSDIEHILGEQKRQNYRFEVTEVGGVTGKNDRIKRLIPYFEQHRIVLPRTLHYTAYDGKTCDLVHDFIEQEYMGFPVPVHDDMLDALARLFEPKLTLIWPTAKKKKTGGESRRGYSDWNDF